MYGDLRGARSYLNTKKREHEGTGQKATGRKKETLVAWTHFSMVLSGEGAGAVYNWPHCVLLPLIANDEFPRPHLLGTQVRPCGNGKVKWLAYVLNARAPLVALPK